jgi:hypothetical protein
MGVDVFLVTRVSPWTAAVAAKKASRTYLFTAPSPPFRKDLPSGRTSAPVSPLAQQRQASSH